MIEITFTYAELVWMLLLYMIGSFLAGCGRALFQEWRKKKYPPE